jgi:uncharacterized LabA/DUF88 family protein
VSCALFWDYENVSIPNHVVAADVSNSLRQLALQFGQLTQRRLYHDPAKHQGLTAEKRTALDQAGFTLVDCPSRGSKETVDKKIIVDVMHFAMSRVHLGERTCVVLVSSDGDYAYMLSLLRDLRVHVVVVYHAGCVAPSLIDACDTAVDWEGQILVSCRHAGDEDDKQEAEAREDHLAHQIEGRLAALAPKLQRALSLGKMRKAALLGRKMEVLRTKLRVRPRQISRGARSRGAAAARGAGVLIDAGDLHLIEPSSAFARSCALEGRFDVEALRFVDGDDCDHDHASGGGDGGGHGDNVAEGELYMALEPSCARRIRGVAIAKPLRLARGRAARLTKAARKAKGGRMNHMKAKLKRKGGKKGR